MNNQISTIISTYMIDDNVSVDALDTDNITKRVTYPLFPCPRSNLHNKPISHHEKEKISTRSILQQQTARGAAP